MALSKNTLSTRIVITAVKLVTHNLKIVACSSQDILLIPVEYWG